VSHAGPRTGCVARAALAALALAAAPGCKDASPMRDAGSEGNAASTPPPAGERLAAILSAEHRRAASAITDADQQSRDVEVRRAAARALARIGGPSARPGLLHALADEDREVVAWGAYGLGFSCKGNEAENVSSLVARAVALADEALPSAAPQPNARANASTAPSEQGLDPTAAIARAVGRCGAEASEPTIVAWLAGPRERAVAAAYAAGDLAQAKQKLREETLAALLNAAAGSAAAPPVPEALFAVGRLDNVPLTVVDRIREVAIARLEGTSDSRVFAIRALGRAGDSAVPELKRVLVTPSAFNAGERADAARALKRLGKAGQRALGEAIVSLAPSADPIATTALVGADFGALLTALRSLDMPPASARKALADLAAFPPPKGAPPAVARRVSWLRCSAAKLLAGADFRDKILADCDVTGAKDAPADGARPEASTRGSIGARAAVAVIGRGEVVGPRLAAFREFARGSDVRARVAALELLETHEEIDGAGELLAEALTAKAPGLIETAAEVLAKQPQRALDAASPRRGKKAKHRKGDKVEPEGHAPPGPSPAITKALLALVVKPEVAADPEMLDAVVDAVGALGLKEARGRLDELCRGPYPTTREHAEKALGLITGEKRACEAPAGGGPAPAELDHITRGQSTLAFDTDVGALTMTLDATLAPVVVTRIVDLARAGYYDGMVVHRVEPGFVTQFGSPIGDGFGGPEGKRAIRCETAPLPFDALVVGLALSGRDTGSSQLFVMHSRSPHLDGQYPIFGAATGPWDAFVDGDVIHHVRVSR
jgi:cyclophilin family peptidyl-prolyl cis-trans isomerase/HEAT repeat protein